MNVIQTLTLKSLGQNKKRTSITIVGVGVCVAMLCALSIILSSLQAVLLKSYVNANGNMDFIASEVSQKDALALQKDFDVRNTFRSSEVASAELDGQVLDILAVDTKHTELVALKLLKGKYPSKENEIVISQNFNRNLDRNYKVGDTITLPLFNYEEGDGEGDEVSRVDMGTHVYIITGIATHNGIGQSDYYAFTNYDKTSMKSGLVDVAIQLKSLDNFNKKQDRIVTTYEASGSITNSSYLSLRGVDSMGLIKNFAPIILLLISIILLGTVSLIYNAFSISLSERSRYLGMLSSVGATKKQKRNSVFFEAFIIGSIAIPLGIIFGIIGISITLALLNPYVSSFIGTEDVLFETIIDWRMILVSVVFSIFILVISAWIPAIRASNITAISAILQNKDFKIRARDVKTKKITRKLFGVEAELGLKNMKRNRARYLSTLLSLVICIALSIVAQCFSTMMSDTLSMMQSYTDADVLINFYGSDQNYIDMNDKAIRNIINLSSVKKSAVYAEHNIYVEDDDMLTYRFKKLYANTRPSDDYTNTLGKNIYNASLQILSNQDFKTYCKEMKLDEADFKQDRANIIVINKSNIEYSEENETKYENLTMTNLKKGDQVTTLLDSEVSVNDEIMSDKKEVSLNVQAVCDQAPSFNKSNYSVPQLMFVVNEQGYQAIMSDVKNQGGEMRSPFYEIQLIANDIDDVNKEVNKQLEMFPYSNSSNFISLQRIKNSQRKIFVDTMLYGFVALILLICGANIINSFSTSIEIRKREFAMIKSIGITKRKFYKMIAFETMFYAIKAFLYGIPMGTILSYLLYRLFVKDMFSFSFLIDIKAYLFIFIGVMLMLTCTMYYSLRKIRNDNIVETIRKESI